MIQLIVDMPTSPKTKDEANCLNCDTSARSVHVDMIYMIFEKKTNSPRF